MTTTFLIIVITIIAPPAIVALSMLPLSLDVRRGIKNWE